MQNTFYINYSIYPIFPDVSNCFRYRPVTMHANFGVTSYTMNPIHSKEWLCNLWLSINDIVNNHIQLIVKAPVMRRVVTCVNQSTSKYIHTYGARAKTGGYKGNQGRQEIQGKRRIPNGDKLSLYTPEY